MIHFELIAATPAPAPLLLKQISSDLTFATLMSFIIEN